MAQVYDYRSIDSTPSPVTLSEAALDRDLSEPTPETTELMGRLEGDLIILGAGGKMGPSLSRLAARSLAESGRDGRVTAVSRFSNPALRSSLAADGIRTIAADLLERDEVLALPDAPNVIFMAGQKFGTDAAPALTWALNVLAPTLAAERFGASRIVAFSSGNVYPLWPVGSAGPSEADAVSPVGEYAQSVLGRERVLQYASNRVGTPVATLRLNYAVEPRYGVLREVADSVRERRPIPLGMACVNVIWQRDANAIALRALEHCASPPLVLNVSGAPPIRIRWLADRFAERWGMTPRFVGDEHDTALLTDSTRCVQLFGAPLVTVETMIDTVAQWVERGGSSLDKPTHFDRRDGEF